MSQSAALNMNSLFAGAAGGGDITQGTALVLTNLGTQIQTGMGISVDDVQASAVTIVTQMPDDSGSIRFSGNSQVVRDGHNGVLDALTASKQGDGILAATRYLNGRQLFPYSKLEHAVRMATQNYDPNEGTPLYDQTAVLLGLVVAKTAEFEDGGVPCRSVTCIITDGEDEHSSTQTAGTINQIVTDMLRSEKHIIIGMGIGTGNGRTDFYKVFTGHKKAVVELARQNGTLADLAPIGGMGLWPKHVLTPGNNASEIRAAFQVVSQSAVRASQGAASFSQTAAGGFGA